MDHPCETVPTLLGQGVPVEAHAEVGQEFDGGGGFGDHGPGDPRVTEDGGGGHGVGRVSDAAVTGTDRRGYTTLGQLRAPATAGLFGDQSDAAPAGQGHRHRQAGDPRTDYQDVDARTAAQLTHLRPETRWRSFFRRLDGPAQPYLRPPR